MEATKRARRPCAHAGCMQWATIGSYCDQHYAEWQERRQQLREERRQRILAECDRKRPNANRRGYSAAWNRARKGYLIAHPLCVRCGVPATEVDHIIPHKGDRALFWDVRNWQSLCHQCHSRKTMDEVRAAQTGRREKKNGIQPGDDMNIFYIK